LIGRRIRTASRRHPRGEEMTACRTLGLSSDLQHT
jgi:hypothetical protein